MAYGGVHTSEKQPVKWAIKRANWVETHFSARLLRVATGTKSVKLLVVKLLLFNKHPVKIQMSSAFVF